MIRRFHVFALVLVIGCAAAPPVPREDRVAIRVEGMTKTLGLT